jgi:small subunit ribosomal protein S20
MPIIKSARKRVKVAEKANLRNVKTKRSMREALKDFSKALAGGNAKTIAEAQQAAVSAIDKAAKKEVIHKNKAARQKARLSAQASQAGAKAVKSSAKPKAKAPIKPAPKKPSAKKPAIKKPVK